MDVNAIWESAAAFAAAFYNPELLEIGKQFAANVIATASRPQDRGADVCIA